VSGSTTANTFSATNVTASGNLTFTGTGNRIIGDFSNATVANRVAFQTSTVNGQTPVNAIPNGTSTLSGFVAHNSSDPANASRIRIATETTFVGLYSDITGTGTYLPMLFLTGGSERMRIDTSGKLLVGKTAAGVTNNGVELSSTGLISTAGADAGVFYAKTNNTAFGVITTKSDVGGTNTLVGAGFANGTFGQVSDVNKKKNIEDSRGYLDDLMQIRVVKYNWKSDEDGAPKELGWIAQEVEQIFPGMVSEMQGSKLLKKEVFVPMMMKSIQELKAELDTVKAELATLKGQA
jgi:hypothetical protein